MTSSRISPNSREVLYAKGPAAAVPVAADINGNLKFIDASALIPLAYDYLSYTATSSTVDTYVYKTGGSGGTTVATVTITYTDSTHDVLVSTART